MSEISYLADTLVLQELLAQDKMTKNAGELVSSLFSNVKDYVASMYDKENPVTSVLSFLGPGILFKLGFPWLAVMYEVAGALGFDWTSFWINLKNKLSGLVTKATGEEKVDEGEINEEVDDAVEASASESFSGSISLDKLKDAVTKYSSYEDRLQDALIVRGIALQLQSKDPAIVKKAGILSLLNPFKGKLAKLFIRLISWVVKTAFISLGFATVGGGLAGMLGIEHTPTGQDKTVSDEEIETTLPSNAVLVPNKNINPAYTAYHQNDMNNVWLERGFSVSNIEDILTRWAMDIYPQFVSNPEAIKESPMFRRVVDMFKKKNKGAEGFRMTLIPPPFTRVLDIINSFAGDASAKAPPSAQVGQKKDTYIGYPGIK